MYNIETVYKLELCRNRNLKDLITKIWILKISNLQQCWKITTRRSFLAKVNQKSDRRHLSIDCSLVGWWLCRGQFVNRLYQSTDIIDFRLLAPFPLRSMCPWLWPTTTSSMLGPWPGQSRWISLLRDSPLALRPSLVIPLRWIDCAQLQSAALDAPQARARRTPVTKRKREQERERERSWEHLSNDLHVCPK